jgi:photosystem II stability/assembly factor-like uncharacterized protein
MSRRLQSVLPAAALLGLLPAILSGAEPWTHIGPHGFSRLAVSALAFDPGSGLLYAATNEGVFRKVRHEEQWTTGGRGALLGRGAASLAMDPLLPATLYAGTAATFERGAFRSDDSGDTWKLIEPNGAVMAVAVDPQLPSTVFAMAHFYSAFPQTGPVSGGIFKSTDRGEQWREVHSHYTAPFYAGAFAFDPRDSRTLYAGVSRSGVLKSTDGGESCTPVSAGFDGTQIHALLVEPHEGVVLAGTDRGLHRSGDGGAHWTRSALGLPNRAVLSFAVDPLGLAIYAGTNGAGVFRSDDQGLTWAEEDPPLRSSPVISLAVDAAEGTLYAGTQQYGVFRKAIDRFAPPRRAPRRLPFRGD